MLFNYKSITNTGEKKFGVIDAANKNSALLALQNRGLIISSIKEGDVKKSIFNITFKLGNISNKDILVMSRQISTLFESQVSVLKAFNLIALNTENKSLVTILDQVGEDIKAGNTISQSLAKHPKVFSDFYVNMVKSGEESGELTKTFSYLAEYLDRQYQLTSKTKNALIYPAFVIGVFFLVMMLMFTFIIPKLAVLITESGQEIPFFTGIIMGISSFIVHYGLFLLLGVSIGVVFLTKYLKTPVGRMYFDTLKISMPVFGNIYTKLYLSRISDNLDTMLSSGIPVVRALELTADVVGNRVYENILKNVANTVKSGGSLSDGFSKYKEIPAVMSGMIRVGEETGSVGGILKTLGRFYGREVNEAVDTMVGLIEPIMIVMLGLGVGILLSSILMPIYNIAGGIE